MSRESLEEAMNAFLKEQNQETQAAMLKEFSAYSFFVPGVFPQGTDLSDLRAKLPGNKIRLPQDKRPFPAVIRNNEGGRFDDLLEHVAETREEVADHLAAD